jgi:arabinogalactan oligomer/maltooligosaccharide transport system permease protein
METSEPAATAPTTRPMKEPVVHRRMSAQRWFRELGWRHLVATSAVLFALFPFAWILMSSINTVDTLTTVKLIPDETTFRNFTSLFEGCTWKIGVPPWVCEPVTLSIDPNRTSLPFATWLWNSVKIALLVSTIQLALSALAAYSFARLRWRGRRTGLVAILLIQMFPQFLAFVALFLLLDTLENTFSEAIQVGLWVVVIPLAIVAALLLFLAVRSDWSSNTKRNAYIFSGVVAALGVLAFISPNYGVTLFPKIGLGTHTGLVLVYLGGAIGVNTWLIKGFMDSIPTSLDEAAKVDGATEWDVFSKIVLPLSRPILIVIFIITFVALYNEYILAAVLIRDLDQFTYATGLALFVESEYAAKWGQLSAAAVIGTFPILILFLMLQDRIVSGLQGAVKG